MESGNNRTGKIVLKRDKQNFLAGFCIIKEDMSAFEKDRHLLHPIENDYYNSLKSDKRKISYLLGRVAAKRAIAELSPLNALQSIFIDTGVFQFPVVKNSPAPNMQVCISHCDNIGIAIAFPEHHPMGIDIERIDADKINAVKDYINDNECALAANSGLTAATGLTLVWTIKEGMSKVFKTGLMMEFKLLEIKSLEKEDSVYISTFQNVAQYKAISTVCANYVCTIVLPRNTIPGIDDFLKSFSYQVQK
jgi:4'-phosphopantetheinyl transferase